MSAFGSPGNDLSFGVVLRDANGLGITVTTKSTYYPIKGDAFAAAKENMSTAWTWSETTGVLTAGAAAAGRYLVMATVNNVTAGAKSDVINARLELSGSALGPLPPPHTAADPPAAHDLGTIMAVCDVVSGDTIELNVTSDADGDVVTVRDASIVVIRIGQTP